MTAARRVARGCGCAGLIAVAAAVVMVVALIAWLIAAFSTPEQQEPLQPVPSTMPPPAAEAPPAIDIHAPGRTSDLLFDWSQDIGNATDISGQAVRAYANAALIAAESLPDSVAAQLIGVAQSAFDSAFVTVMILVAALLTMAALGIALTTRRAR